MDRDANIDEINRELAWLRARYRLYAWAAAIAAALGSFFPVAALLVFLRIAMNDPLHGAFFVVALAIALACALGHALDLRWIDVVSQSPRCIYNRYFVTAAAARRPYARSEAELIEWQIAARERRLTELSADAA